MMLIQFRPSLEDWEDPLVRPSIIAMAEKFAASRNVSLEHPDTPLDYTREGSPNANLVWTTR
jgi:hypothetical protein